MSATLVDMTGKTAVGYVAGVPGEVVRPQPITLDSETGAWTVELTPNAGITSDVGDTLWAITEGRALDGTPVRTYIVVPETGGPYWVGDLRADLSDIQTGQSTIVYLPGPAGPTGATGPAGADGQDGSSAYQVAVANGFVGTETAWLASLVGPTGAQGPAGATGPQGPEGPQGDPGPARPGLLTVTGQPDNTLGIDGDWAISPGEKRIYGPKTAGVWETWSHIDPPTATVWQRNGLAALVGTDLYLTHAADGFGSGTCWRTGLEATDGLDVTFECEMSGGSGADGITFALADPATAATFQGGGGGDLGLVGCTAVALALDTGAGSRARIVTTTASTVTAVATYGGVLNLRPAPVLVRVLYQAGAMSAWLDGVLIFDEVTVAAGASARIGWTGANGGNNDDHIIRNVSFVPKGGIQL
jgi:hypothetical protein